MEKDHMMEKREPHDAMNLFKEVQQKILFLRNQEVILDADVAELKAAQEKLTQSAQKVFAKMYEQAQAAQGAAGAGPNPGAGPDMGSAAGHTSRQFGTFVNILVFG